LGLIARCRRLVVVGDKKQLPPTNFFDRMIADDASPSDNSDAAIHNPDGAAPITDLESILSLCEARGLESQMLRWHYRSRHPSLIEVSNAEFYHRLVMLPAPVTERGEQGLKLRRVEGAYDRGGKRTNEIEAHAVAEAVARHARKDAGLSLGIVTFSTAQRDLIADILEAKRRNDSMLDACLSTGGSEDLFIKNLENVQGDERDVILISIGYGPREAGQPLDSMAFGPVSAEGGERRLNVLFTRARVRCEVFVSFAPTGINLERASGEGPRVLKRFLQYAASGILEECLETGADFDSPFEAAVAEAIESIGYEVEPQVGSAGFKIDLAVRDPLRRGRYMLAIECDGATYHSALWARERDRLRQQVLENLGWKFHRIWSTDWFYRRGEQLEKLRQILDGAHAESAKDLTLAPHLAAHHQEQVDPCTVELRHAAYELASCDRLKDIDEDGDGTLGLALRSIIAKEGPIHRDEIIRRIGHFLGKQRPAPRIAAAVAHALELLPDAARDVCHEAGFWFTQEQKNLPIVRDRSAAPASLRRIAMISTIEISAAISIARQQKSSPGDSEISSAVASLFGLPKPSAELRALVRSLAT
jgi:very-short-patch-repair endonuclease